MACLFGVRTYNTTTTCLLFFGQSAILSVFRGGVQGCRPVGLPGEDVARPAAAARCHMFPVVRGGGPVPPPPPPAPSRPAPPRHLSEEYTQQIVREPFIDLLVWRSHPL